MSDKSTTPQPQFACFGDSWQHYASQHAHPVNQALHAAGTIGGLI